MIQNKKEKIIGIGGGAGEQPINPNKAFKTSDILRFIRVPTHKKLYAFILLNEVTTKPLVLASNGLWKYALNSNEFYRRGTHKSIWKDRTK
jgi:hypothetical protein